MKVLFLIDNLAGGGAEKVLIDILKNINTEKFKIELFLIRNKGIYLESVPKNIKINYIYNDKKYEGKALYKIFYFITKLHFKINRILGLKNIFEKNIKGKKYDLYVPFLEGASMQLISDSKLKEKKIGWIHTEIGKHKIINEKKENEIMKNMDKLVAVSEGAKKSLIEKYPNCKEKTTVINNPIDIKEINKKAKEKTNFIKGKEPLFISIGRVEKVKGQDLLLEAHKKLIEKGYKHKVIILGEGLEKEELEKKAKEYGLEKSFQFIGFKKNPYKYLSLADYYVMSSRYEGYPLSLCEAIALEKPIITSDFEAASEMLLDGELGLIFQRENIDDLAEKMEMFLQDKKLISKLKDNCRKNKENFDFKKTIKKIENLLEGKE